MNKTKILIIAVAGLILLNIGTLGYLIIQKPGNHGGGPPHGEGPKKIIIEKLHFNDEQQKQYEILIEDHRTKTRELNDASRELHDQLYSLLKSDSTNRSVSDSLIEQIADNQKQIENLNFDHFQKIRSICKGEQLKYFDQLAQELSKLFGQKGPPPRD